MVTELGIKIPDGDPGGMEAGAAAARSIGGAIGMTAAGIERNSEIPSWVSSGAARFAERSVVLAAATRAGDEAMTRASTALSNAAAELAEAQEKAKALNEEAKEAEANRIRAREIQEEAQRRVEQASSDLYKLSQAPVPDPAAQSVAVAEIEDSSRQAASASDMERRAIERIEALKAKSEENFERWNDRAMQTGVELRTITSPGGVSAIFGLPRPSFQGMPTMGPIDQLKNLAATAMGVPPDKRPGAGSFFPPPPPVMTREERERFEAERADQADTTPIDLAQMAGGAVDSAGTVPVPVPQFRPGGPWGAGLPVFEGFEIHDAEVTKWIRKQSEKSDPVQADLNERIYDEDDEDYQTGRRAEEAFSPVGKAKRAVDIARKP